MTTLLLAFFLACGLGLLFTPLAAKLGCALGALDFPDRRKTHSRPVPRTGGLGLVCAHILSIFFVALLGTEISGLVVLSPRFLALWAGALIVFSVGFYDDFKGLDARIKLVVQVLAASVAFAGGVAIEPGTPAWLSGINGPAFHYFLTVFWFVLLINAMNLIDGLDGLAGGIAFFVCLVLAILQVLRQDFLIALYFIALAGNIAGFLRYNFSPASVFMGDGGSYYLGYMIAGVSILGALKSQVGVTLTLSLLAMGVPVFDALFAPVRRFLMGRKPFQPDKQHLHHKLLALGLTSRRAVLILYATTAVLCGVSLLLVNLYDEEVGLLLILMCAGLFAVFNGLGYLRYVDREKVESWFRDVGFVTGLHRDRRRFLDLQMRISKCRGGEDLCAVLADGLEMLDFDYAEMRLVENDRESIKAMTWRRSGWEIDLSAKGLFKMELPLQCEDGRSFGELWLVKDLRRSPLTHYTLTRIEHLRRAVLRCLLSCCEESGCRRAFSCDQADTSYLERVTAGPAHDCRQSETEYGRKN